MRQLLAYIRQHAALIQVVQEDLGLDAQNQDVIDINTSLNEILALSRKMSEIISAYSDYHKAQHSDENP